MAGKNAPAFTVASLAMIMHGTPATFPMPATAPAAGMLPHCSIHFVGGPKPEFEEGRTLDRAAGDALAREQTSHLVLAILAGFAAAFAQNGFFSSDGGAALAQTFRRWSRRSRHERERLTPRARTESSASADV